MALVLSSGGWWSCITLSSARRVSTFAQCGRNVGHLSLTGAGRGALAKRRRARRKRHGRDGTRMAAECRDVLEHLLAEAEAWCAQE
jgi:hypothetical protein